MIVEHNSYSNKAVRGLSKDIQIFFKFKLARDFSAGFATVREKIKQSKFKQSGLDLILE
jgi:hypothetical protein